MFLDARPAIIAAARDFAQVFGEPLSAGGEPVANRGAAIEQLNQQVEILRAKVEEVTVEGSSAVEIRNLTLRALDIPWSMQ